MKTPLTFGKWRGLARIADENGRFKMLAADQRPPLEKLVAAANPRRKNPNRDIAAIKRELVSALSPESSAVLLDPLQALPGAAFRASPRRGLIVTLERHDFAQQPDGRVSGVIPNWSAEKIKRMGGDAVKVLAWHHPRAGKRVCAAQKEFVRAIGAECRRLDIPLILELLLYPLDGDAGYAESPQKRPALVLQSVRDFADAEFGVDLFKLESPVPAASIPPPSRRGAESRRTRQWFEKINDAAGRPWVVLSAGATAESFSSVVHYACESGAAGYLAGRAIWMESVKKFPDMSAVRADLKTRARPYMARLNRMVDEMVAPRAQALRGRAFGMNDDYPDFGGKTE